MSASALAVTVLGDERQRRRDLVRREAAELLGSVGDELAVQPEQVARLVQLEEDRSAVDVLDRAEPELEGRHDAEVAAAAADRPEQVGVVLLAGDVEGAVAGDHVRGQQVVEREAEPPREVADAAAEGQPADAGGRDDAARRGQPEGVRRGVQVAPRRAARDPGRVRQRVDPHTTHGGQVDDHAVVAGAEARDAVATTADRDGQVVVGGEAHRGHHVAGVGRLDDDGGALVDHPVADLACFVVPLVVGAGDGSPQLVAQRVELDAHDGPSWSLGLSRGRRRGRRAGRHRRGGARQFWSVRR